MKKLRTIIDINKEEEYLKEMAQQGWGVVNYNSWDIYTFEKIVPRAINYRIDYRLFKKQAEYIDYLTLFEDSGWQHLSGTKNSGFQIFTPKDSKNLNLDIFSDDKSGSERYMRLYRQAFLWFTLMIFYSFIFQPSFENIQSWYLTPSLWTYTGLQLIGMIVMETLFLIIQLLPTIIFMLWGCYFAIVGTKVKKLLKEYQ